jgi:ribosomal-protein-alanine acetyltransferase
MSSESNQSPRIRPVEASRIGELIRLGEETNLSPWTADSYADELKNPDAIMLRLAGEDNSTLGFLVGRIVPGGEVEIRLDAEIYNIAVGEEHQRRGYGQQLFDAFIGICHEKGAANIWLEVRESNQRAIRFYEKNGFERVQSRSDFYDNPREHALLMRFVLKYQTA